jgi:hypothetical protein
MPADFKSLFSSLQLVLGILGILGILGEFLALIFLV